MLKKILLTAIIIYIPNSLHFPSTLGLPGLNVFNLLFLGLLFLYLTDKSTSDTKPPLSGNLKFYYIASFIALLISLVDTSHFVDNVTIFKNIVVYSSLYFIFFKICNDENEIEYYIKVVYFVVFLMCLEIIKEKLSYGLGSSKRVSGAFGHDESSANYAGVFLAIFIPLLLKNYLYKCNKFTRPIFALGIFFMGVFSIFYTYSRQSYLSLIVTSILNFSKKNKILLITLIILLFNASIWVPDTVLDRIEDTKVESTDGEEQLDESSESRFVIWQAAYDNLIVNHPFGIGLNEFKGRIDPYMPDWIRARDAHNSFVLIMTESGFIGLIAFILLILRMYYVGGMIKKNATQEHVIMLGEGYQLMVVAVVLGNVYSSTFYSPEIMGNFWILSALIHKYYYISKNSNTTTNPVTAKAAV
ncbi:MAG TPA: O-antigen ligase family protein [Gammaproteobacteria bacterium]